MIVNKFKRHTNRTGDELCDLCRHDNNNIKDGKDKTVFFIGLFYYYYYYYSRSKHALGVDRASATRRKTIAVKNVITINIYPETS